MVMVLTKPKTRCRHTARQALMAALFEVAHACHQAEVDETMTRCLMGWPAPSLA
jgi:hypothetical protein